MASTDLVPSSGDSGGSALKDFLSHTTIYEKAGAVIPRDLLQFGLFGSVVVIATGLLALAFPDPGSVERGQFFLLLASTAAGLDSLMHAIAVPAIVSGLVLLGVDVYLMQVPTSERWRWAVVGQAAAGGAGGVMCTIFLALVLLNLALWIAIGGCILAGCAALLAGLAGG